MNTPVKCLNCGIKWLRVVPMDGEIVFNWDVQVNCPRCGSNWSVGIVENDSTSAEVKRD